MTQVAPSRTALWGMWALLSAVQNTGQLKWWPSHSFYLNLAKNCKTWLHWPPLQFVHPAFENAQGLW